MQLHAVCSFCLMLLVFFKLKEYRIKLYILNMYISISTTHTFGEIMWRKDDVPGVKKTPENMSYEKACGGEL